MVTFVAVPIVLLPTGPPTGGMLPTGCVVPIGEVLGTPPAALPVTGGTVLPDGNTVTPVLPVAGGVGTVEGGVIGVVVSPGALLVTPPPLALLPRRVGPPVAGVAAPGTEPPAAVPTAGVAGAGSELPDAVPAAGIAAAGNELPAAAPAGPLGGGCNGGVTVGSGLGVRLWLGLGDAAAAGEGEGVVDGDTAAAPVAGPVGDGDGLLVNPCAPTRRSCPCQKLTSSRASKYMLLHLRCTAVTCTCMVHKTPGMHCVTPCGAHHNPAGPPRWPLGGLQVAGCCCFDCCS